MKKIISMFLVVCFCALAFAACGDTSAGGSMGTTQSTGNVNADGGTANSANTNGGNNATESGSTNAGGNENTVTNTVANSVEVTEIKGEAMTEEQWSSLKTNSPTNYSYVQDVNYNGAQNTVTMLINGDEYEETIMSGDTLVRKSCGVLVNGKIQDYAYDEATEKWSVSNSGKYITYPMHGMPYALADFTFDAQTGTYAMTMTNEGVTAELKLRFKDGVCIYIAQLSGTDEIITTFYDYGTTVVTAPDASAIVDGGNSGAGGSFGGQ